jgi:cytochrome c peroxidase
MPRLTLLRFLLRTLTLASVGSALLDQAALAEQATVAPAPLAADRAWILGAPVEPQDNPTTAARVALGQALFFDPRISGNGTVSCSTCHNPALGWSDGLRTGMGIHSTVLGRKTPTVINTGYNTQFMWDGRKASLEDQALGPMSTPEEMQTDFAATIGMLEAMPGYRAMFDAAYPAEGISKQTMAKAIAAFERTVVSKDSRFDRWVAGDRAAITQQEWRGYQVFKDPAKGNCEVCHAAPNFTDNGFHNIGVADAPGKDDAGRYKIRPVASMRGAFKTPTLRDVERRGPYFHNGSAETLMDVVDHYARGGDDHRNLSKEVHPLDLSAADKRDLVAFLRSLSGSGGPLSLPVLPILPASAAALGADPQVSMETPR